MSRMRTLVSRNDTLLLARRGSGLMRVVPLAAYTAIQSDCRTGYTSRNKMASFKKFNLETVRLAFPEKTKTCLCL